MYFGPGISVGRRGISYGDSDAQAFISATGLTGTTEVNAVNNLVANLKTYGLWSKMKAIYPFVSDTINLLSYSQDYTNVYWNKGNTTVTANTTTAPDGTNTANSVIPNTTNGGHSIYVGGLIGGSQVITATIYAKAKGYNYIGLSDATTGQAVFDLVNGTLISADSGITASAPTNAGNGWWRCKITFTATTNRGLGVDVWNNSTKTTYAGNNVDGVYLWGAQLELGSSATTYQPIATTPANRFVSQFKYNLKDPRDLDAAFRLAFNGTWAYSKQGATPNGVNGYANTYLNTKTQTTFNSLHLSFYSRTDTVTGNKTEIGNAEASFLPLTTLSIKRTEGVTADRFVSSIYSYAVPDVNNSANTDSSGYYVSSRLSATSFKIFKNATQQGSTVTTNGQITAPNYALFIGANNGSGTASGFSDRQTAFSTIGDGLTDTEATNLYTSVQQFNQDLSRQVGVPIVSDADAQSFLNAAQITDLTQANAINTLVVGLKNASLWTKMKAIYPFVGGTATSHKWNLKDPRDLDAAYRLAFFGAWTHSSTGITGNGISTYAVTYLNPSINLPNSQNSSIYIRTYATGGSSYPKQFAAQASPRFNYLGGLNHLESYMGANTTLINDGTNTIGYFSAGGDNTLVYRKYRNNARITKADVYLGANTNMNIGDSQANFTTACNISFFNIGDSLTDSEISSVYNLVQNFQTTLGRQV